MKPRRNYTTEVIRLSKAIDIAVEAFRKHPPKDFLDWHTEHFIKCYLEWREMALNPEPQYKSLASLKYIIQDVFTAFNETSGLAVEYFWKKVEEQQLGYERIDMLMKIFERGKIRGRIEYEFATDIIVVYQQEGRITAEQASHLGAMIEIYEIRPKKIVDR